MTSRPHPSHETFRFGDFELDVSNYQLRCRGRSVRLERRPMDLLVLLVERRGQLVTRNDIVDQLWGKDVFVDVETGVNTLVWKVRGALRDSPEAPTFVETVAGRGYRFIAPVEVIVRPARSGRALPVRRDVAGVINDQPERRWLRHRQLRLRRPTRMRLQVATARRCPGGRLRHLGLAGREWA